MHNLNRFVAEENAMEWIFAKKPIKFDLNKAKDRKVLRDRLECNLSPENLCCDGELSGARLIAKTKYLRGALAELNKLERS